MRSLKSLLSLVVLCSFSTAYSAVAQGPQNGGKSPQTRPAPGGQQGGRPPQQGGNRPSPGGGGTQPGRPNPGSGNRPSPGGGNRPSPGGGNQPNPPNQGGNRPQPGRPNPGGGNNGRPPVQPGRPNPGGSRPPSRPNPSRPGGRPPQWGRPPQNRPSYNFRRNDRDYLRRHYMRNLSYINLARRPRFVIGGFFPYGDIGYLTPLPPDVYGYLPPPPMGYQMGYFEGYVVVYDPLTYFIANVIDLVQ